MEFGQGMRQLQIGGPGNLSAATRGRPRMMQPIRRCPSPEGARPREAAARASIGRHPAATPGWTAWISRGLRSAAHLPAPTGGSLTRYISLALPTSQS